MKAMRDVWGDTLVALGKANPNVPVLDADLGVLHVPSIKPLDREELIKACEPFKTIVTVERTQCPRWLRRFGVRSIVRAVT